MDSPHPVERPLTRRRLLQSTAAASLSGALAQAVPAHGAVGSKATGPTVAVFGAGVAGMSAAHELAERGYRVTLFEPRQMGGKARSLSVPGTGVGGRKDLPAEHGFRAIFSFYRNLPDILKRIPFGTNAQGVYSNLVPCGQAQLARAGAADLTAPFSPEGILKYTPLQIWESIYAANRTLRGIPLDQLAFFARQFAIFLTSGDARRFGQWEYTSWWDFTRAGRMSAEYRKQLADGLTRNLAAAKPQEMSVNSTGIVGESFGYSVAYRPAGPSDRAMGAPTNEAWIDPWTAYLKSLGVNVQLGWAAADLEVSGGTIAGATVQDAAGKTARVDADYFVCAMPVERAMPLFKESILQSTPQLRKLPKLRTEWMNGVIFHLDREVPVCDGHISYVDSQSALTSISQAQLWRKNRRVARDISRDYGDGRAKESFSSIISDWKAPGLIYGKPLWSLRREQVIEEVWEQTKAHLNDRGKVQLTDDMIVSSFLDTGIQYPAELADEEVVCTNEDPLMINTPGSWDDRPGNTTGIPNLKLASDYVRNEMNCATMESACETGRAAAQAVVDESGFGTDVGVFKRWIPPENQGIRRQDDARYRRGQKNILDFPWTSFTVRALKDGKSLKEVADLHNVATAW